MHMLRGDSTPEKRRGPVKGSRRRGFGRLRRERSGCWSAAYIGPDQKLHRASTTFEDEDAARGWIANERKLIDLEVWTAPGERAQVKKAAGQTVTEFASDWLENRRTAKISYAVQLQESASQLRR